MTINTEIMRIQKSNKSFTRTPSTFASLYKVLKLGLLRPFSMRMRLEVSKPHSKATSANVRFCFLRNLAIVSPSFKMASCSFTINADARVHFFNKFYCVKIDTYCNFNFDYI